MAPEQDRWAEALRIEQMLGDFAPIWIAERIASLARAGDREGVERFRDMAKKHDQLRAARNRPDA